MVGAIGVSVAGVPGALVAVPSWAWAEGHLPRAALDGTSVIGADAGRACSSGCWAHHQAPGRRGRSRRRPGRGHGRGRGRGPGGPPHRGRRLQGRHRATGRRVSRAAGRGAARRARPGRPPLVVALLALAGLGAAVAAAVALTHPASSRLGSDQWGYLGLARQWRRGDGLGASAEVSAGYPRSSPGGPPPPHRPGRPRPRDRRSRAGRAARRHRRGHGRPRASGGDARRGAASQAGMLAVWPDQLVAPGLPMSETPPLCSASVSCSCSSAGRRPRPPGSRYRRGPGPRGRGAPGDGGPGGPLPGRARCPRRGAGRSPVVGAAAMLLVMAPFGGAPVVAVGAAVPLDLRAGAGQPRRPPEADGGSIAYERPLRRLAPTRSRPTPPGGPRPGARCSPPGSRAGPAAGRLRRRLGRRPVAPRRAGTAQRTGCRPRGGDRPSGPRPRLSLVVVLLARRAPFRRSVAPTGPAGLVDRCRLAASWCPWRSCWATPLPRRQLAVPGLGAAAVAWLPGRRAGARSPAGGATTPDTPFPGGRGRSVACSDGEVLDLVNERVVIYDGATGTFLQTFRTSAPTTSAAPSWRAATSTSPSPAPTWWRRSTTPSSASASTSSRPTPSAVARHPRQYGLADRAHEITWPRPCIARRWPTASTADRPRFVAGSMGPGTKFRPRPHPLRRVARRLEIGPQC